MSSYPTDDAVNSSTPVYDQTLSATAVHVEGDDSARSRAADAAGRAGDTAKQAASQAKGQAQQVGSTAADAGQRVASTTKDQASKVASDAVGQARELYGQATGQLSEQAAKQQRSAASALRTLGGDLSSMQQQHEGGGLAAELVSTVSDRADRVSDWLESREPAQVLDEVKQFAARRPGLFIGLAAVAGVVAARATKALVAEAKPDTAPTAADEGRPVSGDVPTTAVYSETGYYDASGAPATGSTTGHGLGDIR